MTPTTVPPDLHLRTVTTRQVSYRCWEEHAGEAGALGAEVLGAEGKRVVLHSLESRNFNRAHLYVGLSRVKRGEDIRIAP